MRVLTEAWQILKQAAYDWVEDKASEHGAALAFYSLLSLAPLFVICIAIAAFFFDEAIARENLVSQIGSLVGEDGAKAVEVLLTNAHRESSGIVASMLGIATLIVGSSAVFGQLQDSLNTIWKVPRKKGWGIWDFFKARFLSFAMVLGVGFLLLVSLVISAMIAGTGKTLDGIVPGLEPLWHTLNDLVSLLIITFLFAMIFKILPDVEIDWRDVWFGAVVTALLFTIGKLFIGLYLGKSGLGTTYGAAGSLVVLIVWVYYSAQILFFGAELTQVYAKRRRHGKKPRLENKLTGESTPQAGE